MSTWLRSSFAVAVSAALAGSAAAQTTIQIGPMVGVSSADVRLGSASAQVDVNKRTGFLAGAFLTIGASSRFAIQPEVFYSQQGAEIPLDAGVSGVFKLDYIQVPVLAQVRFPTRNAVPFVIVGPSLGVRAGCQVRAESGSVSVELDCDDPDLDAEIKSTDVSGVLGVGIEVSRLTISARYNHGVVNLNDQGTSDDTVRNRVFSLVLGYGFRVGR